MKVFVNKIVAEHPVRVQLDWEIVERTEVGTFTFDIDRSGSPGGPWTTIVSALSNVYTYEDTLALEEANTMSLSRDIYYRVKAIPPSGALNAFYSPIISMDGIVEPVVFDPIPGIGYRVKAEAQYEPLPRTNATNAPRIGEGRMRLLKHKILREQYVMLKKIYGMEYYLLKRRHFGTRCPVCYDPISRTVSLSDCATCYGTSWTGGYYTPMLVYGKKLPMPVQAAIAQHTKAETARMQIQFQDFPTIAEEDVIVEKVSNRRYLVLQMRPTSLKTINVHQTVTVSELERQAIEYKVPVTL